MEPSKAKCALCESPDVQQTDFKRVRDAASAAVNAEKHHMAMKTILIYHCNACNEDFETVKV